MDTVKLIWSVVAFVALSAASFPISPICAGIHKNVTVSPIICNLKNVCCISSKISNDYLTDYSANWWVLNLSLSGWLFLTVFCLLPIALHYCQRLPCVYWKLICDYFSHFYMEFWCYICHFYFLCWCIWCVCINVYIIIIIIDIVL